MRRMSVEILAAEKAAEHKPSVEGAFDLIPPREHAGLQYVLLSDDLIVKSGRYSGQAVSVMVRTVEGRDYVGQLWKTATPEMKDVIRRYFSD